MPINSHVTSEEGKYIFSPGNIGAKHEVSGENFSPLFSNRYIIRALEKLG